MTSHSGTLDAASIRSLLNELSDRLANRNLSAQLFVVGGAAMSLAYDASRSTRDIDALFVPAPEVRRIAESLSEEHGLEPDWLNDSVKGFLPGADADPQTVFESESLLVQVPSARYLLAMKILASRDDRDLDDAAILMNTLGYTSGDEALRALTSLYPVSQLLPKHRYLAQIVANLAASKRQVDQAEMQTAGQPLGRRELNKKLGRVERTGYPPQRNAPDSGPGL